MAGGTLNRTAVLTVVGKADTKGVGQAASDVESATGRIGKAWSGVRSALNAGGLNNPFAEWTDSASQFFDVMNEKGGSHLAKLMTGMGVAMASGGALFQGAADKDKVAHAQLQQAIDATGKGYEGLDGQIEKAIKTGVKYGNTANQTQDALTALTNRLGDPKLALQALGDAFNVAAVKHEDLGSAAELVGKMYENGGKQLKEFGITLDSTKTKTVSVQTATDAHSKAVQALTQAQANVTAVEARVDAQRAKGHETAAQAAADAAALQKAHDAVSQAQTKVASTQAQLTAAMNPGNTAAATATQVHDALQRKLGGDASASANTFTGHMKALKAQVEDMAAKVGGAVGGPLMAMGPVLAAGGSAVELFAQRQERLRKKAEELKAAQEKLKAAAQGVTKATQLSGEAAGEAAAGMDALGAGGDVAATGEGAAAEAGAGMDIALGPILLIVGAVALLALGVYELVKHWKTVWDAIKTATSAVWNDVLKPVFGFIVDLAITPVKQEIQALGVIWGAAWSGIKDAISFVWNDVLKPVFGFIVDLGIHVVRDEIKGLQIIWNTVWSGVKTVASDAWNGIKSTFSAVKGFFTGIFGGLASIIEAPFDAVKGVINNLIDGVNVIISGLDQISFKLPSWVPFVGGKGFSIDIPQIPHLAAGGITTGPTLALIGDNPGGREAVIPLPAGGLGGGQGQASSGDINLTVQVGGFVDSTQARTLAMTIRDELLKIKPTVGALGLA